MASEGPTEAQGSEQLEERERRLAALGALAREQGAGEMGRALSDAVHPRRRATNRWQRWMLFASIALAMVVIATVVSGYLLTQSPKKTARPKSPAALASFKIDLTSFSLYCPQALAWSPDGSQFAVLASSTSCLAPNASLWPDTIAIFDTANGEEYRYFTFSAVLPHSAHIDQPVLTWSPNGKFLATVAHGDSGPGSPGTDIMIIASVASFGVLSSTEPGSPDSASDGSASDAYIWHIEAQGMGAGIQHQISYPIPAAMLYTLDATDLLAPVNVTLPDPSMLMGSPVASGAGRYSLWENGVIARVSNDTSGPASASPAALYYSASVPMWSGDGAYLAPSVGLGTYPLPGDSPQVIANMGPDICVSRGLPPCAAKAIPYPDKAFQRAAESFLGGARFSTFSIPVAWRPDGKLMATILPGDFPAFQSGQYRVSVSRTDTGETAQTFTAPTNNTATYLNAQASLAWSPNGVHLSFVDYGGSSVSVWTVAS